MSELEVMGKLLTHVKSTLLVRLSFMYIISSCIIYVYHYFMYHLCILLVHLSILTLVMLNVSAGIFNSLEAEISNAIHVFSFLIDERYLDLKKKKKCKIELFNLLSKLSHQCTGILFHLKLLSMTIVVFSPFY